MRDVIKDPAAHIGRTITVCSVSDGQGGLTARPATVEAVTPHTNHLGGRWHTVALTLTDDGSLLTIDSRAHVLLTPDYTVRGWCPECRSRREVTDVHDESAYVTGGVEEGFTVTDYTCGHSRESNTRVIGAAPGAPYAGPVPVAATAAPRDVHAAVWATQALLQDRS